MTSKPLNNFQSKLPHTQTSIFTQMSQLAAEHQAVNLSQGFPDFPVSVDLINLVTKYMQSGFNQYAPMPGLPALREAIALKYSASLQLAVCPDHEITITAGGTQGLYTAIGALVHPADEVILFEPAYDSYRPSVEAYGGKVVPIMLYAPDFQIDWSLVEQKISPKTKLIILNNPNNPTGTVFSRADIAALEHLVEKYNLFVLSDEVYEHLVYEGATHCSVLQSESLRERSFVVASFGKLLHATGWKLGYVVASKFLMQEFRKLHQFNVFSVNTPMQMAIAAYLRDTSYYASLSSFFEQKRNYLRDGLQGSSFKVLPCQATYFMLLDYSGISDQSELEFAKYMTQAHQVAMIPVSAFYSNGYNQQLLRICFAKKEETLDRAIENLLKL